MSTLLQFKAITKSYGTIKALDGIDLEVPRGSTMAVLGPNGAGKSTLFGCLLGTVLPDAGTVQIGGEPVSHSNRRKFGYLPERITLYPQRTVWENASYLTKLKGIETNAVAEALKRVGIDHLARRKVSQVSKGQLQRAGLAIALAGRPDILVLDEPFNGLDPVVLEEVLEIVRQERERGATLLVSTHTISAAEEIATDVAMLLDGRISVCESMEALRRNFPGNSLEAVYHTVAKGRLERTGEALAA